ncbi:DNAJ heat shock N-terminal domain-containing protein [Striga hermonthica]|uniref:DNAJ heat shock N-terminal domain-containing protein n=1 Tax=Striga hermonthica TaxID=68872 RepID=A0A9N7NHE1_STRHE|nr:DNAJ heat shock N-terminal domain-containing protein [Striga hermonthica]
MECNKDEAVRAKSIAEAMLEQKDYTGSKQFALKAQTLYPGLDGILQMVTILDVYMSAERKINGHIDWYGVLGVDPTADDDTIKKKYRKLALILHPDKNRSAGAEDAFKLINEGWTVLSDKTKRLAYDFFKSYTMQAPMHAGGPSVLHASGRGPSTYPAHAGGPWPQYDSWSAQTGGSSAHAGGPWPHYHSWSAQTGGSSAHNGGEFAQTGSASAHGRPPTQNSFSPEPSMESPFAKFLNRKPPAPKASAPTPPNKRSNAKVAPSKPSSSSSSPKVQTFWTICSVCKIQYEYDVIYRDKTLLCIECKKPFLATVIPRPVRRGQPCSNAGNNPPPSVKSEVNNSPTPLSDTDMGQNNAFNTLNSEAGPNVSVSQAAPPPPTSDCRNKGKNFASDHKKWGPELTDPDLFTYLTAARPVQNGPSLRNHAVSNGQNLGTGQTDQNVPMDGQTLDQNADLGSPNETPVSRARTLKLRKSCGQGLLVQLVKKKRSPVGTAAGKKKKMERSNHKGPSKRTKLGDDSMDEKYSGATMNVPDPDFYNFDRDRSERSFAGNEVWATYDDEDGMPRLYAMVHRVVSRSPFELKMSWLNSKTTSEFGPLDWVGSGFSKTCGEFRVGKYEVCRFVNAFSHRVRCWTRGPRGAVVIFPEKGDAWALYRNWSPEWGPETPEEVVHKYDVVSVVEVGESGVTVSRLVKVAGYRTVFRPSGDGERITREEMLRFSHQVPHHQLARGEALEGCVELDPAALPMELLERMPKDGGEGLSSGEGGD